MAPTSLTSEAAPAAIPPVSDNRAPAQTPGRRSGLLRRSSRGKAPLWVLGVVSGGAAAIAVVVALHHEPAKTAKSVAAAPVPVGAAKAVIGDMNVVLVGLGAVTPEATVTVQTQVNGQLQSVGYQEGQIVQKGQCLAQIDPRPYQAALVQAQGALAKDTGLLNQAKSDLQRYQVLEKEDSIAKQTVADQQFLVDQDQGAVRAVTTGVTDGDTVQILSGLQPGDLVITDGDSLLRDGARVRIVGPSPGIAPDSAGSPRPPDGSPDRRSAASGT